MAIVLILSSCKTGSRFFCRPDREVVKFDFEEREFITSEKIWYKDTVIVKITNINRSLFEFSDQTKTESFNLEAPSAFSGIALPAYLRGIGTSEYSDKGSTVTFYPLKSDSTQFVAHFTGDDTVSWEPGHLIGHTSYYYSYNNTTKSSIDDTIQDPKESLYPLLFSLDRFIRDTLVSNIDVVDKLTPHDFLEPLNKFISGHRSLQLDSLKLQLDTLTLAVQFERIASIDRDFQKKLISPIVQSEGIAEYASISVDNLIDGHFRLRNNDMSKDELLQKYSFEMMDSIIKTSKDTVLVSKAKTFIKNKGHDILRENFLKLNKSNFEYTSKPIVAKGDEVLIDLVVKSSKQLPMDIESNTWVHRDLRVAGGIKIDFSPGLFIIGGNETFLGKELQYQTAEDTTMVKIININSNVKALLGLGGLVNIGFRSRCSINPHLSFGISTNTGFDTVNGHVGLSLSFGRKNRLLLSGGYTFRQGLDQDFGRLEEKTTYLKKDVPEAVPTRAIFPKKGHYIAIAYNLNQK